MNLDTDPFETLVADIYDAAADPVLWPTFLERLRRLVGSELMTVFSVDKPTRRIEQVHHTKHDKALWDSLSIELPNVPVAEVILEGMIDTPASSLSMMSEEEFNRSEFYQRWMQPWGMRDGTTCPIVETADQHILLGYCVSRNREPVTVDEMALLQRLSPHLRRAFMIGETLERTRWEAELALTTLSKIQTPILICDANGHLIFANAAGETAFSERGPLNVRGGRVEPRSLAVQTSFADALRRAASSDLAMGRRGIGVPLAAHTNGGHAYVLPLLGSGIRRISGRSLVAVFVSTHKGQALPGETVLMTLFDLTPAEARVMAHVGQAQSTAAVGAKLGVKANTLKTHLSHIFRKTGCASQAELVKLMSSLSLPVNVSSGGEIPPPPPATDVKAVQRGARQT
ncbi:MAG: helix-turn-helix transcriptional regulator [Nevskiaceae bacterium]|nr:helix-turn-helix transcriptional regulator [Nevskiaceae bacterium]